MKPKLGDVRGACALALALVLTAPAVVAAWGPNGHRVVGQIAENHLTAPARAAVDDLLAPQGLAQVSTWADEVRPERRETSPWHYISIEDDEAYSSRRVNPGGDVVSAIREMTATLNDREADQPARVEALKFLVHFVGDVHQPLHVGRAADRGGNDVIVDWFGTVMPLHKVWDEGLIESEHLSFSELSRFLDQASAEDVAAWQQADLLDWVRESHSYRQQVYELGRSRHNDLPALSWDYRARNLPLVKRRLLQAGVRLAALLNDIFTVETER